MPIFTMLCLSCQHNICSLFCHQYYYASSYAIIIKPIPIFRSSTWWDDVVLNRFGPRDWRENFRISKASFDYLCHNLKPLIEKANTSMRRPVSVERRVAVTLWILATPSECRSVSHLFGLARCTVCLIVHETCKAIIQKFKSVYINFPTGENTGLSEQVEYTSVCRSC